jgi:cytochrome P450
VTGSGTTTGQLPALFAGEQSVLADPWPLWHGLREASPVAEHASVHLVLRYGDVKAVLRDRERFSNDSFRRGSHAEHTRSLLSDKGRQAYDEMWDFQALFVVATDGEQHDRLRRIAHRAFTPRRIGELEAATTRYVDRIVTSLAERGEGDLMELAFRVPLMIICDLLGVPLADQELIKQWSSTWNVNRAALDDRVIVAWDAMKEFRAYVESMLDEHRRAPNASNLVAALMGAEQDERLTPDELAAMFWVLLFAGHETTTNLIGNGLLELLRHRDQWELLAADPSLATAAVEELLRFVSPVQWVHRLAIEDVELDGCMIPDGATVYPVVASANRDPNVFSEPDRFDIHRADGVQHVGFGFGTHFCLGASLARLEAKIAFQTFATRFPRLELSADPDSLTWGGGAQLRGLTALPVRLGPERQV